MFENLHWYKKTLCNYFSAKKLRKWHTWINCLVNILFTFAYLCSHRRRMSPRYCRRDSRKLVVAIDNVAYLHNAWRQYTIQNLRLGCAHLKGTHCIQSVAVLHYLWGMFWRDVLLDVRRVHFKYCQVSAPKLGPSCKCVASLPCILLWLTHFVWSSLKQHANSQCPWAYSL